jgi:hypothetical protein
MNIAQHFTMQSTPDQLNLVHEVKISIFGEKALIDDGCDYAYRETIEGARELARALLNKGYKFI